MRFSCRNCGKDFTSFSERDEKRKLAFTAIFYLLDKIACPHCNATNRIKRPKPLKQTSARWQPKHKASNPDDYDEPPTIVLFDECRKRWRGSDCSCEGCPSVFNCLTGNIDDGKLETDDPNYVEKKEAEKAELRQRAIDKGKLDKEVALLTRVRAMLGAKGISITTYNSFTYVKIGGTTWKLLPADIEAIGGLTWDTEQTSIIQKTLIRKKTNPEWTRVLLKLEIRAKNRV